MCYLKHKVLVLSNYNNVYLSHHFLVATYDTKSIDITSTSGEVCVVCRFSIYTIAVGCEIQLQNNNITQSVRFDRDVNIAEGCISNISSGYYDLYVYYVENDNTLSQLPAIIKNQVFVDEPTTTKSTTTVSITTRTSSLISTLSSLSPLASSSIFLILSSSISSAS